METDSANPQEIRRSRPGPIAQFVLPSLIIGFLSGLFEALLLWTSPRVAALQSCDVRYVIWFLAPLVDMAFFGIVGTVLGWLAEKLNFTGIPAAVESGISVAFVALTWRWFHVEMALESFSFHEQVLVPFEYFCAGFALSLAIFSRVRHLGALFEHWLSVILRPAAWGLALTAAVAMAGVCVFEGGFSNSLARVLAASSSASGSPNIVFITLDTVRADRLSSYGYSRDTTPHLDRFARRGVLFENAIAPSSWTLASHASMFTGLLPHQHGAGYDVPMPAGPRTLAEILHSRGYETAAFTSNFHYLERGWGLARGFETYEDNSISLRENLAQTFIGGSIIQPVYQNLVQYDYFNRRNAGDVNQNIFGWLKQRPRRPYFLFVNYLDAHEPYAAPRPYNHRFGAVPESLLRRLHHSAASPAATSPFNTDEQTSLIAAYDNCIAYLDGQVGRLLDFLRRSSDWENTIVIVTSDHGEEFGEHGRYSHGKDLYRETLHVPLIIAGPKIPRGFRISHVVATQELFSTVLDLAGGGNTPFSRYSLARFWKPGFKPQPFDNIVVSELAFPWYWRQKASTVISVTTPEWQLLDDSTGRAQLYRWTQDPRETVNLAGSREGSVVVRMLQRQMAETITNSVRPWQGADYLLHLGGGGSFLSRVLFSCPPRRTNAENVLRVGASQEYFHREDARARSKLSPSELDVMHSLPYQ